MPKTTMTIKRRYIGESVEGVQDLLDEGTQCINTAMKVLAEREMLPEEEAIS